MHCILYKLEFPDIEVKFDPEGFKVSKDNILDFALELAQKLK